MNSQLIGKSILVTGANGGIGLETVKILADKKLSRLALACRTLEKAEWTKEQLPENSETRFEPYGGFDMTSPESIKNAVAKLPANEQFDIVFLQSGGIVVADDFQFITTGNTAIERTVFQNVLGGYLTVKYLKERELLTPGARIVFAGGEGARGIPGMIEKPVFNSVADFQEYIQKGRGQYNVMFAIGVSKFASALLVQKLAQEDSDNTYVWFSPGLTGGTNGLDTMPNPKRFIMKHIGFPMLQLFGVAQSPKQAALKYVDALEGKYGENGDIIGAPEGKALGKLVDQKPMNAGLTNQMLIEAFWKITTESVGDLKEKMIVNQ
ncbi:MAG: SDR family NAD(P)-dependent oxidoreductase [Bacteroidetes bacterium]|nr:MAG: SDR family NAD(P)-dependent oxidoreductase [Bacteroidota bacterium]